VLVLVAPPPQASSMATPSTPPPPLASAAIFGREHASAAVNARTSYLRFMLQGLPNR
jgi:hypothetical protein